jgi:hypothetical protein
MRLRKSSDHRRALLPAYCGLSNGHPKLRTRSRRLQKLATAFEEESAIAAIGKALQKRWSGLHDDVVDTKPRLSLVSRRFEEVVNKIAVIFEQDRMARNADSML